MDDLGTVLERVWVSTLAVEWIEILFSKTDTTAIKVSTLAVEWIEISCVFIPRLLYYGVSTLAVEWIEIHCIALEQLTNLGLHPRGGVD